MKAYDHAYCMKFLVSDGKRSTDIVLDAHQLLKMTLALIQSVEGMQDNVILAIVSTSAAYIQEKSGARGKTKFFSPYFDKYKDFFFIKPVMMLKQVNSASSK